MDVVRPPTIVKQEIDVSAEEIAAQAPPDPGELDAAERGEPQRQSFDQKPQATSEEEDGVSPLIFMIVGIAMAAFAVCAMVFMIAWRHWRPKAQPNHVHEEVSESPNPQQVAQPALQQKESHSAPMEEPQQVKSASLAPEAAIPPLPRLADKSQQPEPDNDGSGMKEPELGAAVDSFLEHGPSRMELPHQVIASDTHLPPDVAVTTSFESLTTVPVARSADAV
eukprot:gnl/TRDRNA2_/TRDRNA2_60872_c0_seq1.p1 gnl/TRDRNA2_/TRDRNA2_60872_c0~~gnl/TRDRNA2_/TRDRNA2_60872_c0_seq1.p1  ORF type:complete len:255 (+),score=59.19 gnl/TRDRNA2_/TRDRNA2_60872_c0_seq1:98-766(+)